MIYFKGLLKRSRIEEKEVTKKVVVERVSPVPDYSILRQVLSENKGVIAKVFSIERNDIVGIKRLLVMFPSLLRDDKYIPKHIMNVVLKEKDSFSDTEYNAWVLDFYERVSVQCLREGIDIHRDVPNNLFQELTNLSNLDLWYLKNKIKSDRFNQFLFQKISVNRLRKILPEKNFYKEGEKFLKGEIAQFSDNEYKQFLSFFNMIKEEAKDHQLTLKSRKLFYDFLDCSSQKYIVDKINKKTAFELSYIMLELNQEYFFKLLRSVKPDKHLKILELTSENNLVIKDARFLSSFIREIEKDYFQGRFSLIST